MTDPGPPETAVTTSAQLHHAVGHDQLLDCEIFYSLPKAQILIEAWRRHYNGVRAHSSLNCRPPAPESFVPRSGGIVPWASAPSTLARSPTPNMALETAVH